MMLVYQYVSGQNEKLEAQYAKFFPMVIATRDILQYETIRPSDIETIRVPAAMVPPGIINDPKDVIDAVAAVPIARGEQILDNKIISKNIYSGLDTAIAVGRRAMSIPVSPKNALGYHVRPGNRIDLAAHFEYKGSGAPISEVKVFLQDVLVLASGRNIQPAPPKGVDQNVLRTIMSQFTDIKDPREAQEMLDYAKTEYNFNTITIEVTPTQAQIIVYVLTVYADSILVLLRHSDDRQLARRSTTNLVDVMGPESYLVRGKKLPPPRAIPRPKYFDLQGGELVGVPAN